MQGVSPKELFDLLKKTYNEWSEDKAPRLAAALSYYTLFSLAPLILIVIAIVSLVYKEADGQLRQQIASIIPGGGDAINSLLESSNRSNKSGIAAVIGFATLLLAAGGFFGQLQDALNTIWEVQLKPNQGIMAVIKQRFFSFSMVLGTAFLLLVSLVLTAVISLVGNYFSSMLPGADIIWQIVNQIVAFAITTLIFALIFKIVPDADVQWRDVWIGAAVTALLFTLGQLVLSWYLSNQQSTYGAFGSLIVLLLWTFYSAQILFFGAEFTQVYANSYGSKVKPAENAVAVTDEQRAQQGMPSREELVAAAKADEKIKAGVALTDAPAAESPRAGVGAVAGFLVGLLLARRGRNNKSS